MFTSLLNFTCSKERKGMMDNHPNASQCHSTDLNCHGERTDRGSSRHACEDNLHACEDNTTNFTAGDNDRYFSPSHEHDTTSSNRRHYSISSSANDAGDTNTKSCISSSSDDAFCSNAVGRKEGYLMMPQMWRHGNTAYHHHIRGLIIKK